MADKYDAKIMAKVGEYLAAGVTHVCILDEQTQTARVFSDDGTGRTVAAAEELTFTDILPRFAVKVARFFE